MRNNNTINIIQNFQDERRNITYETLTHIMRSTKNKLMSKK